MFGRLMRDSGKALANEMNARVCVSVHVRGMAGIANVHAPLGRYTHAHAHASPFLTTARPMAMNPNHLLTNSTRFFAKAAGDGGEMSPELQKEIAEMVNAVATEEVPVGGVLAWEEFVHYSKFHFKGKKLAEVKKGWMDKLWTRLVSMVAKSAQATDVPIVDALAIQARASSDEQATHLPYSGWPKELREEMHARCSKVVAAQTGKSGGFMSGLFAKMKKKDASASADEKSDEKKEEGDPSLTMADALARAIADLPTTMTLEARMPLLTDWHTQLILVDDLAKKDKNAKMEAWFNSFWDHLSSAVLADAKRNSVPPLQAYATQITASSDENADKPPYNQWPTELRQKMHKRFKKTFKDVKKDPRMRGVAPMAGKSKKRTGAGEKEPRS